MDFNSIDRNNIRDRRCLNRIHAAVVAQKKPLDLLIIDAGEPILNSDTHVSRWTESEKGLLSMVDSVLLLQQYLAPGKGKMLLKWNDVFNGGLDIFHSLTCRF